CHEAVERLAEASRMVNFWIDGGDAAAQTAVSAVEGNSTIRDAGFGNVLIQALKHNRRRLPSEASSAASEWVHRFVGGLQTLALSIRHSCEVSCPRDGAGQESSERATGSGDRDSPL